MGGARCIRCGSYRLRRSHSRTRLQKALRRTGLLDRYACGACGQRGWTWGELPAHGEPTAAPPAAAAAPAAPSASAGHRPSGTGGRRLESRDLRLKRRVQLRSTLVVVLSLLLGILAALYLQRCGGAPAPVE